MSQGESTGMISQAKNIGPMHISSVASAGH